MSGKNELLETVNARFPHIVAKLKVFWGHPEFLAYINHLFHDTRNGTRQGFPKEIALALWKLQQLHDQEFPHLAAAAPDAWSSARKDC